MQKVIKYQVNDHGPQNCQMFQGHGTAFSDWDDCAIGTGDSFKEAFEDAKGSLAQNDWDVSKIRLPRQRNKTKSVKWWFRQQGVIGRGEEPNEDCYYYVSIDVRGKA